MTIQTPPTQTALPVLLTIDTGIAGLVPDISFRRGTDWLDFADDTFRATPATRQATMSEIGTDAPGSYEYVLDVSVIGAQVGDIIVAYSEVAGTVYASETITIISAAIVSPETQAILDAINAQTAVLLAVYEPGAGCASPALVTPSVYTGHKGDAVPLPVYRGEALMGDSELVGSTGLVVNFYNADTQTNVQVTSGITVSSGFASYTTTAGDLVYETAGKWQAQAEGVATTGEPWRSQVMTTSVEDEVA